MALNDVYRVAWTYDAPGANPNGMVYVIHYRTSLVGTPLTPAEEAGELAGELLNSTVANYLSNLSAAITLRDIEVIGVTEPTVGVLVPSGAPGVIADDPLPHRNAFHTTNKTGLRGRSYNGRTNLMAPPENVQDGGIIDNAYQTAVVTYMVDISSPVGSVHGTEWQMVIRSEELDLETDVTQIVSSNKCATVRNRQTA